MYINGQRPHKQTKYTKTKYITQYGPTGQSENCININMCSNEQRKKQMNNMYKNSKLHKSKVQKVNVNG